MRIRPDHARLSSVLAALFVVGVLLALWPHDGVRETEAIGEVAIAERSAPRAEKIEPAASEVRPVVPMPGASARRDVAEESMDSEAHAQEEAVVDMLVEALEDPDPRTFADAVDALSRLDPERLESVLGLQLEEGPLDDDSDESEFRSRAAWGLGVAGGQGGVDFLIRAFEGSDPAVQEAAANGLAQTGDERAREFLVEAAGGSDPERKSKAISALAFEGDEEARSVLAEAFERGLIALDDVPDDALEELSIALEGAGCLGPDWVYPSCSRASRE